jgi:exo-1,4-beta-D-glucosaminidase
MEKTVPTDQLWDPESEYGGPTEDWNYHCGAATGAFGSLTHFQPGMTHRYGNATSAADYLAKAQLEAYESHRAMFEACA